MEAIQLIDHDVAVRQRMTESYLLDELDPAKRDEFEEHFFDCQECVRDVQAGVTFVEQSKVIMAEESTKKVEQTDGPEPIVPVQSIWRLWLRPVFAVPLLTLLAVVGYQNIVELPLLRQPTVLPMAAVNVGTFAGNDQPFPIPAGKGFLLLVRIPPDGSYSHYKADLQDPGGSHEGPVTIPAIEGQNQWPVQFPTANRQPGTYTLVVYGVSAGGESKEIGRKSFDLQLQ